LAGAKEAPLWRRTTDNVDAVERLSTSEIPPAPNKRAISAETGFGISANLLNADTPPRSQA
jgi:hypothetical protein